MIFVPVFQIMMDIKKYSGINHVKILACTAFCTACMSMNDLEVRYALSVLNLVASHQAFTIGAGVNFAIILGYVCGCL